MLKKLYYLLAIFLTILAPVAARAEGSRDLTSNGQGFRPFLEDGNTITDGIPRRNTIQAYAVAGETIELGSSAIGTATSGGANIVATAPDGTRYDCRTIGNNAANYGRIANRTQELGTFTPCVVPVGTGQTGIWEIQFLAPASTYNAATGVITRAETNNPTPGLVTNDAAFPPATTDTFIAAWDVTVKSGVTAQSGRVFANYLALNAGFVSTPPINSVAYVQTRDGYLYQVDLNGMYPAGFIFFANKDGFTDSLGKPRYQSVEQSGIAGGIANPSDPATDGITHKIFFNPPNLSLPENSTSSSRPSTWLLNPPTPPPTPTNLEFRGKEGSLNQTGTNPLQGTFSFVAPGADIPYSLAIDVDDNGFYDDPIDRVFFGRTVAGTNEVIWDGKDGEGNNVPPSETGYNATVKLFSGEVHFPFIDVERNVNGIKIIRQTPLPFTPPTGDDSYNNDSVYYDDFGLPVRNAPPNPLRALGGVPSANGAHRFGSDSPVSNWGDTWGIDTWVLLPSPPLSLVDRIKVLQADLNITKTLTTQNLVAGGEINYTITVSNAGPSNVTGVGVTDTFPAQIVNPTWTCAITTGTETGACLTPSGSGNINTTVDLNAGAVATFTVTAGLAPTATAPISNSATVTRPDDVADPVDQDGSINNNDPDNKTETSTATYTTAITPANPRLGIAKEAGTVTANGDGSFSIPYTLVITNTGNVSFNNVQVTEDLTATFGNSPFTITSLTSSGGLTVNSSFNGDSDKDLLAGSNTLLAGETRTIQFTVTVTPRTKLPPYQNTAQVGGTTPGGVTVTDDSTDGNDPDSDDDGNPNNDNDGDPTNNNQPTVVSFEVPRLGVAKAAGNPVNNNDGSYTIPYTLLVRNTGDVAISNLQVSDDLRTTFGTVPFEIVSGSVVGSTGLTVNGGFDGKGNNTLLAGSDTLAVDAEGQITFDVVITPGSNLGPFNNTARANGTTPTGATVEDDSTNGGNPDPDGDGNPGNNSVATSVRLQGIPNLRLVKRVTRINQRLLTDVVDDPTDQNDDSGLSWPANYLQGQVDVPDVLPGEEVEYTIYFLSDGSVPANNVRICDRIPDNQTFVSDGFTAVSGSAVQFGTSAVQNLTNASDTDFGTFFPVGTAIDINLCSGSNTNGALIWNLGNVPNYSANQTNSFGFVRFRSRVK